MLGQVATLVQIKVEQTNFTLRLSPHRREESTMGERRARSCINLAILEPFNERLG